jgi:hypothetical protein
MKPPKSARAALALGTAGLLAWSCSTSLPTGPTP